MAIFLTSIAVAFYDLVLIPLMQALLKLSPLYSKYLNEKLQKWIEGQKNPLFWNQSEQTWTSFPTFVEKTLMIHAASGEIEYAKPVIRALKEEYPNKKIIVTFTSFSSFGNFKKLSEVEGLCLLPIDHKNTLKIFFKKLNPEVLLISRTDAWLNQVIVAKKLNISTVLFSATFAKNSSRLRFPMRILTQKILEALSLVFVVSEDDLVTLNDSKIQKKVIIAGDTRYDQVDFRYRNPIFKNSILKSFNSPDHLTLILGSTWPEDEKILLPGIKKFISEGHKVVIAPHEVSERSISSIVHYLSTQNIRHSRLSEILKHSNELESDSGSSSQALTLVDSINQSEILLSEFSVIIIDTIGILADLYSLGHIAFVGGSFKKQVHSVMEPLIAGLPVMVGPYYINNREAIEFNRLPTLRGLMVQVVHTSEDIEVLLDRYTFYQNETLQTANQIRAEMASRTHATEKLIAALRPLIATAD